MRNSHPAALYTKCGMGIRDQILQCMHNRSRAFRNVWNPTPSNNKRQSIEPSKVSVTYKYIRTRVYASFKIGLKIHYLTIETAN
jgi:hypothetical protein